MTGSSSSSCCCKSATGAGKNRDPMLYHPLCRIYCSPCNSTVMQSSCDFRNEIRNARFSGKPSSIFCTWNSIQKSLHLLKTTLYFSLKRMESTFVINPWKQNYYYYCRFQIYQGDSGVVWSKIQSFVLLPHKIGLHREMMNDANRDGPTLLPSNSKICQHGLIIQAEIQETRGMIQKG